MSTRTHTVINQAPPLVGYDVYAADAALTEGVARHTAPDVLAEVQEELGELGRAAGSAQAQRWGEEANAHSPVLRTHDRYGNRIDEVDFHPAYHRLLGHAVSAGLTDAWSRPSGHLRRAAGFVVWTQAEQGHGCPVSMTHAAVPALRTDPVLAAEWEPRLTSRAYAAELLPPDAKPGALFGMGMTEKQGGSDVRANTTRAEPLAEEGTYLLTGHKWFCSAPMSDGFLVLAQAPGGLTCFLLPASCPTAPATSSASSASRTSSATAPTPPPRSSSTAPGPAGSARRGAGSPPSSRWSPSPAWTAPSVRPPSCARPSPRPSTTPPTARRSAGR
jgi:putative acyl-CoA dehydrogenase